MTRLSDMKEAVCAANLDLVRYGLVILTWGNVSGCLRDEGLVVIKPSGVSYDRMTPDTMVVVNLDGEVVEGDLRPSSDTDTHLVLYRAFPDIGGVTHTHSTYASAWAQSGRDIPVFGTTHADYFATPVPCTRDMLREEIEGRFEHETGNVIVETIDDLNPMHTPAVLVKNHAPFTWGTTAEKAVEHSVVLEEVARMAAISDALNPKIEMNTDLVQKHFLRKHGPGAYYGQKG